MAQGAPNNRNASTDDQPACYGGTSHLVLTPNSLVGNAFEGFAGAGRDGAGWSSVNRHSAGQGFRSSQRPRSPAWTPLRGSQADLMCVAQEDLWQARGRPSRSHTSTAAVLVERRPMSRPAVTRSRSESTIELVPRLFRAKAQNKAKQRQATTVENPYRHRDISQYADGTTSPDLDWQSRGRPGWRASPSRNIRTRWGTGP